MLRGGNWRLGFGLGLIVVLGLAARPGAGAVASQPAGQRGDARADRVIVDKGAHRLTLWCGRKALKIYRVALGSGGLAPKVHAGDNLVPEGTYRVDGRNAQSGYHRTLHISYPNAADLARAKKLGVAAGGDIMIHGIRNGYGWIGPLHRLRDWTRGCIAVTDREIEEIWRLVPVGTSVEIRP
jgi:murein L,D-transpeptidase YafK